MASKKRDPKRAARIELRKLERKERQRSADRERLFATMPAGSRATAMDVPSSAVIEARAAAIHCPQCNGRLTMDEHTVDRDSAAISRASE